MNPQDLQTLIQMASSMQNNGQGGGYNFMQGASPLNRQNPGSPYMGMGGGGGMKTFPPPSGPIYGGYPPAGGGGPMTMPPEMSPPEYQDGMGGAPSGGLPPELAMYFGGGRPPIGGPMVPNPMGGGPSPYTGNSTPYGNDMRPMPLPPTMSNPSTATNQGGASNYWTPANIASARPMNPFAPPPMGGPPMGGRDPRMGGAHVMPPSPPYGIPPYSPPGMKPGYGPPKPRKPPGAGGGMGGAGTGGIKPAPVNPPLPRGIQNQPPRGY